MSRCENFLEMSSRYLDGDLNPDEEQSLLSHLAECPDCRRAYEAMRAVSLELDVTDAPEGFAAGVMGAVRAAAPGRRPRRLAAGRGRAARIAALAACCALIAAAGLKLASESGPAANESEPASFGAVSVERDIAPANAGDVVDRDITGDDAEPAVSASSCAARSRRRHRAGGRRSSATAGTAGISPSWRRYSAGLARPSRRRRASRTG